MELTVNHQLLRAKIALGKRRGPGERDVGPELHRIWNVTGQASGGVDVREQYLKRVREIVEERWREEGSVGDKWEVLRSALCVMMRLRIV